MRKRAAFGVEHTQFSLDTSNQKQKPVLFSHNTHLCMLPKENNQPTTSIGKSYLEIIRAAALLYYKGPIFH